MAKLKLAVFPCIIMLVLGGCSGFFEFNLFKGLDPVKTPEASDYEGSDGLDQLGEDLTSPAVVDAMTEETVEEIEDMLNEEYLDDGVTDEEDQQAAILLAELNLVTSSGDDVVNNIVGLALDLNESPELTKEEIAESLSEIIPEDVLESPESFAYMVSGFLDANEAYEALGETIDTLGAPEDANMGDVAQKAVVAFLVSSIVDNIVDSGRTEDEAIALLYEMILNPENADPADLNYLESTEISESNPEAVSLMNILEAAGLNLEGMLGGGST